MTKKIFIFLSLFAICLCGNAQVDTRPVVGVAQFTCGETSPYTGLVTEKVVEMLTNTKRFRVVDRTSIDKVKDELELQKTEAFIDSKNLVEQGIAVAAEKMITGHINKIPVYRMKNTNETVRGYKASVSFQMKVVDVATGLSTEATSFEGKASKEMLSPESAVNEAMQSLQSDIFEYFRVNFPVTANILKILTSKGGSAAVILIGAGTEQGIRIGDKFTVSSIEILEGKPYPTEIGEIEVQKLSGESFSECKVPGKIGKAIQDHFDAKDKLKCSLIIQK